MLSPSRCQCVKRVALLRALASLLKFVQPSVKFSGYPVTEDNEDETEKLLVRSSPPPPPPLIPKLKENAVLKALASTVTELEHPFFMGRSIADPLAPVTRDKQMKYLMARDAGVKAAEYVIQKWPELFPSRDFSPDIRSKKHVEQQSSEAALQFWISERNADEALKIFNELEKEGKKVSLETRNNLLELLSYDGIGNDTVVTSRSKFIEHQRLLNDSKDLEFIPANPTVVKKLSPIQTSIDESQVLLLSKSENHVYARLKYPRTVWSLSNSAEKLFELMEDKNSSTYDALIVGLYKYKSYDRMFKLYFTMYNTGYQPSVSTYNFLLMALDHSECPTAWEIAIQLVKNMGRTPVVLPNTDTFNMLLKLSKRTGIYSQQTAAAVFQEMLHIGIKPNLTTFLRLLQAYINNNDPSVIAEIVDYLEEHPSVLQLSSYFDLFFFEAAVNVANHFGRNDISERLVKMASKDNWHLVGDVDKFLSPYLIVVSWEKDIHTLMKTYKWLVSKHYRPKDWTYAALFQACAVAKSPETVLELWADFKKFGVRLESNLVVKRIHEALAVNIDMESIDDYLGVAEESWKTLLGKKILPDQTIIEGMVRIFARAGLYEKAWYYYAQFELHKYQASSSALQCILDAYVIDKCNTVEVMDTLRLMIAKGHHKPNNYDKICSKFGISIDFWNQTKETLKDGGQSRGVSQKKGRVGIIPKTKGRILTRHKHGAAVRVQGDPLSITEHSLAYFFQEYGVEIEDVKAKKHHTGQPNGEALVVFPSAKLAQKAVREKHNQTLGKGLLRLSFKSFSYGATVTLKGIPFSVTEQKIAEFFDGYNVDPERDVSIEIRQDGKLTGNAFVAFSSPHLAERAVREKHKKRIGKRIINLSIKSHSGNYGEDDIEVDTCSDLDHDQSDQIGQRMINHDGDTLLVQGLIPFSTSEDELADFFNVDSKDVQLEVDETGKPTGVAIIKFSSNELAVEAMKEKKFLGRPLKLSLQKMLKTRDCKK